MIAERFARVAAERDGDALALLVDGGRWTYAALYRMAEGLSGVLAAMGVRRVGIGTLALPDLIAALVAADMAGLDVFLLPALSGPDQREAIQRRHALDHVLTGELPTAPVAVNGTPPERATPAPHRRPDRVVLFTSGTSGPPKPVLHTWQSLAAAVKDDARFQQRRWFLSYNLTGFAGLQVLLQAVLTGGTLCVSTSRDPHAIARFLLEARVEFASGTPTFWRMLLPGLQSLAGRECALVQITLGGEAAGPEILHALRSLFPRCRITQIYASTEMGACFAVSDGQPGFPASFLSDPSLPCELRISGSGELLIRSRRAMLGYLDQADGAPAWFETGDLVELRGDRVVFVGRRTETINVGGNKVFPMDVEQVIRTVPGVSEVRVHGMRSSITGEVVCAAIVPDTDADVATLRRAVLAECRARLPKFKVPAVLQFRDHLETTDSGKLARSIAHT